MNASAIDPITLSVILGLAGAVTLVLALVKWHQFILQKVEAAFKALFTFNGFFWIVNLSCMAYSAQNAGYVFGLYETSGFAIGLALDGIIIVFTQVALTAKARGETKRAGLILLFIAACCLLSTIGNLAHNLHTDISAQTSGVWFQEIVPYVTSMVPLLLIALAWVADLKIDPMEKEDPEVYKSNEKKRIQFQTIQIESSERREGLQTRVIAIEVLRRRNAALRRGKTPGSFRWFWEKALDAGEVINGVSTQLAALFNPQIEEMKRELQTLREEKEGYLVYVEQTNAEKMLQFQKAICGYIDQSIEAVRLSLSKQNEQYCLALSTQNEQYRLALSGQYEKDIAIIKTQLNGRVDETLSSLQATINQNVTSLQESFDLAVIASRKPAKSEPVIEMTPEVEFVVNRYPIVSSWLSRPERSVSLQEIIDGTKHTPQMAHKRVKDGTFRRTKRGGHYRLDSVIKWLRVAPLPRLKDEDNEGANMVDQEQEITPITESQTGQTEAIERNEAPVNESDNDHVIAEITEPHTEQIEAVGRDETHANEPDNTRVETVTSPPAPTSTAEKSGGDRLVITIAAMRQDPDITDERLAEILKLKRPASARFWRLKAKELLEKEQEEALESIPA